MTVKNLLALLATLTLGAGAGVPAAHARSGDVAPRSSPDGNVTIADAVLALRFARGGLTPTAGETTAADVAPGAVTEDFVEPPVYTPQGDGGLDDDDARSVLGAALGRLRYADSRVLDLLQASRSVIGGSSYHDTAFLDAPFAAPTVFSLIAPPPGMAIDPLRGDITWTPGAGVAGNVQFGVGASDGASSAQSSFTLDVQQPAVQGSKFVTAGSGGTLEVTNPASVIVGSKLQIPAGALATDQTVSLSTVTNAVGSPGTELEFAL